jgi:hypothetical protein
MRALWAVCVVVVLSCPLALAAEETEAQRQDEILKELRALHESIDELTLRVQALEKKVGKAPGAPSAPMAFEASPEQRADPEVLAKITLPDNPTKEQVREYVGKIVAASQGQNIFSDRDPQVAMLAQVGPDNLDVLLDAYKAPGIGAMGSYHVKYAIVRLAGPQHKDLVLAALPRIPELAQVVMTYGWQSDAKDALIGGLQTAREYLPDEWMQATASLHTPEAYEALKQYVITGPNNRSAAFEALQAAPGSGDLAPTVDKMWQTATSRGNPWDMSQAALIAIPYGHVAALEYGMSSLNDPNNQFMDSRRMRSLILRYTPARGSDQALFDWFDKNRANIVWDAAAKVYRVKEAAATPAPAPAAEPNKGG